MLFLYICVEGFNTQEPAFRGGLFTEAFPKPGQVLESVSTFYVVSKSKSVDKEAVETDY
jgi:hypothetical protein